MAAQRFEAVLDPRHLVEVPFDVREAFGRARAPVLVTVNGHTFRTTVAVYGGTYYVGFNRQVREAAGIGPGDRLELEIALDDQPRTVDVPADLASALDPETREAFDALSFTHRREYVEWIEGAKRDETRRRRVARAVEMLRDGVKTPG
jgi:hypothetical protein